MIWSPVDLEEIGKMIQWLRSGRVASPPRMPRQWRLLVYPMDLPRFYTSQVIFSPEFFYPATVP